MSPTLTFIVPVNMYLKYFSSSYLGLRITMSSTVRSLLLLGRFGAPSGTSRMLSSTVVARGEDNKLVTLTTDNSTGIATVTMQRVPVNSFNYEFSKQVGSSSSYRGN